MLTDGHLIYFLVLPTPFLRKKHVPGVSWSHRARGPCSLTVAERRYLPGDDHCGTHVVLPKWTVTIASFFSKVPLPVTITQFGRRVSDNLKLCVTTWSRLIDAKTLRARLGFQKAMWLHSSVDIGGSISSFAIGLSPSPWPGTASSTLPLSMPRGNLAAQEAGTLRIKPRVGIFFVDFSCGILAVAFVCTVLLFTSDAQLELTFFGRSRVLQSFTFFSGFFFVYFTNDANLECSRPCAGLLRFPRVFTQNRQGKISCSESSWTYRILVLIVGSSVGVFLSMSQQLRPWAVNFLPFCRDV